MLTTSIIHVLLGVCQPLLNSFNLKTLHEEADIPSPFTDEVTKVKVPKLPRLKPGFRGRLLVVAPGPLRI